MTPLELAAFPIREAGNDPHDKGAEPFSASKTSNWVARAGGLPTYIQHVAHAMVEKGKPESKAIQMAVGIVKNWAEGKGGVHAAIKAAAAKAIAQWEAMKGKSKVTEADLEDFRKLFVAECKRRLETAGPDRLVEDLLPVANRLGGVSAKGAAELREAVIATEASADAIAEAYSPPNWVIPKAARSPGFKPLNPTKSSSKSSSSSSSSSSSNTLHPHDPHSGEFLRKGGGPSAAIKGVQQKLGIKVTGSYDGQTEARVRKYQENHNLKVDGIIGSQTAASMLGRPARAPGSLAAGLRQGLKKIGMGKLHAELLEERVIHTEARERANGVKAAPHGSIRSAIYDLADRSTSTHTVKLPNGTKVTLSPSAQPSYGTYGRQFNVTNGKETLVASGVEEGADTAKELDSRTALTESEHDALWPEFVEPVIEERPAEAPTPRRVAAGAVFPAR